MESNIKTALRKLIASLRRNVKFCDNASVSCQSFSLTCKNCGLFINSLKFIDELGVRTITKNDYPLDVSHLMKIEIGERRDDLRQYLQEVILKDLVVTIMHYIDWI